MLEFDARFVGFSAEDWRRFLFLWRSPETSAKDAEITPGGLVAIHNGERIVKLVSTRRGRLPLPQSSAHEKLPSAEELGRTNEVSWAVLAEQGSLEAVIERFGSELREHQAFNDQLLRLATIFREVSLSAGRAGPKIQTWPAKLTALPVPKPVMVERTLDFLCLPEHAIGLGIFHEGELWTSIVLRRKNEGFDAIFGPDEIREHTGLLSGEWRRDVQYYVNAMELRCAPLSLGCFADLDTFRSLLVDPSPGAWGKAVALREVVLSPTPKGVSLALGIDGARFALSHARKVVERYDTSGRFRAVGKLGLSSAWGLVEGWASTREGEIEHRLGFDPFEVLRLFLRREP